MQRVLAGMWFLSPMKMAGHVTAEVVRHFVHSSGLLKAFWLSSTAKHGDTNTHHQQRCERKKSGQEAAKGISDSVVTAKSRKNARLAQGRELQTFFARGR